MSIVALERTGRGKRLAQLPEAKRDWEDEYRRLQEEHIALKIRCNEQEDSIRKNLSKIKKLESDLDNLERQQNGGKPIKPRPKDREEENLVSTLYEQNAKLKAQVVNYSEKTKTLLEQLERKKREVAIANKRRPTAPKAVEVARPSSAPGSVAILPARTHQDGIDPRDSAGGSNSSYANLLAISQKLRQRLQAAEEEMRNNHAEIARLRSGGGAGHASDADGQLREAKYMAQQLQVKYDNLVSQTSSSGLVYRKHEEQLEEYSHRVRELTRTLALLKQEKEIADIKADRVTELEELVRELRNSNRALEDNMNRLCEAPFISEAYGQQESRMRYEDLVRERLDLKTKIEHLQEAVKTNYSALVNMTQEASKLREAKDELERTVEDLRIRYKELETGSSILQEKMRLYSGEDDISMEELERALTVVKKRGEAVKELGFLKKIDGDNIDTMPLLKKKMQDVQVINLNLSKEVERLESMLKVQSLISKDLHRELESLVRKSDNDRRDLQQKANDLEATATKRQEKIQMLEAQLRQHIYATSKGSKPPVLKQKELLEASAADAMVYSGDVQNDLLAELMDDKDGPIPPDQNMMEIWVKCGTVLDKLVPGGSSTFVVIDFFDYESQATGLISGAKPHWDFAATYRITVDDFLFRYFSTNVATFELNMAMKGDFSMLARCTVPLRDLLRSIPKINLENYPMISPDSGEVVAHLTIEMRLALPISELYRLFLERHPSERRIIEEMSAQNIIETAHAKLQPGKGLELPVSKAIAEDESRLYNELEVLILKARSVHCDNLEVLPSCYVYFQLLGYPEKFTNPCNDSVNPVFNQKFGFPMVTNDQQMRLLERSLMEVFLMDLKKDEQEGSYGNPLIGKLSVDLRDISKGDNLVMTFNVKDLDQKKVAELDLSIRWKYPLRHERELGPKALGALEVEDLMKSFSQDSSDNYIGLVDYRSFCRFINPSTMVKKAMDTLRTFVMKQAAKEKMTHRDVLRGLTAAAHDMAEDDFVSKMIRVSDLDDVPHHDILPNDYSHLFRHIDTEQVGKINIDQLMKALNIDDGLRIPAPLHEKLLSRVQDLLGRGIIPLKLFEGDDRYGVHGLISRLDFKNGLRKMGFHLVDDDEAASRPPVQISNFTDNYNTLKQHEHPDDNDVLNDSMGSVGSGDEILLPTDGEDPTSIVSDKAEILKASKRKQNEFKEKSSELQARSNQAAALYHPDGQKGPDISEQPLATKPPIGAPPAGAPRMDHVHIGDPAQYSNSKHNVSLHRDDNGNRVHEMAPVEASHTSGDPITTERKKPPAGPSAAAAVASASAMSTPVKHQSQVPHKPIKHSEGILLAEQSLRFQLEANGSRSLADLSKEFSVLDSKRSGYVNKKQFAFALSKVATIKLEPSDLLSVMKYFDKSTEGNEIDYLAFINFCKYRPIGRPNASLILEKMIITSNNLAAFRSIDSKGSGYLPRPDMLRVLSSLGYGNISPQDSLELMFLFETREDGLVNYLNFAEYVRENSLSQSFLELERSLRTLFAGQRPLLEWFKRIDVRNEGLVNVERLREFLLSESFDVPNEMIMALVTDMDPNNAGIRFAQFKDWASRGPHSDLNFQGDLTSGELRIKVSRYVSVLQKKGIATVDQIAQCFQLYDWRKPPKGLVGKEEFFRSCERAGFAFTESELRHLSTEFSAEAMGTGHHSLVAYRSFLEWCVAAGANHDTASHRPVDHRAAEPSRNPPSLIIRFLEHHIKKGVDLLAVFGRFDSKMGGKITADEFCSALVDLGLSSVTQKDALDVAELFKAAPGANFIMYRTFVAEMLQKFDDHSGAADIDILDVVCNYLLLKKVPLTKLRGVFERYDSKLSGRLRREDIGTSFEDVRVVLRRQELDALSERYAAGDSYFVQYHPLLTDLGIKMGHESSTSNANLATELIASMRGHIETLIVRGVDYCAVFDTKSEGHDGCVTQGDLKDVLERLRISLSSKDFQSIAAAFRDSQDPRKFNYMKMLHELHPLNRTSKPEDLELWAIADTLRQKIRRRCEHTIPGELRRPFQHFCKRPEKNITRESFSMGIREIGIRADLEEERALFDYIKLREGSKLISFVDFKVFVSDPFQRDVIWKFTRSKKRSGSSDHDLIDALNHHDVNSSNLITAQQCARALNKCGFELSESDVNRLMLRFDPEELQRFAVDELKRFIKGDDIDDDDDGRQARRHHARDDDDDTLDESANFMELRRAVKKKLSSGLSTNEVFAIFDSDNRKIIDLVNLQEGARELGLSFSRLEAKEILLRMGLKAQGVVNKKSFFIALGLEANIEKPSHRPSRHYDDEDDDAELSRSRRYRDSSSAGHDTKDIRSVVKKIRDHVMDRFGSASNASHKLRDIFEDVDIDNDGKITMKEMQEALHIMKSDLPKVDVIELFEKLDSLDSGKIKSKDFIDIVFREIEERVESSKSNYQNIIKDIRSSLDEEMGPGAHHAKAMKRVFSDIDLDNNGKIDRREFMRALKALNIPIGQREADIVFDEFDQKGHGFLDYHEFLELFDLKSKESVQDIIRDIEDSIVATMGKGLNHSKALRRAFSDIDTNGNGKIDKREFLRAMKVLNIPVGENKIDKIFSLYDEDKNDSLDYHEFIALFDFNSVNERNDRDDSYSIRGGRK